MTDQEKFEYGEHLKTLNSIYQSLVVSTYYFTDKNLQRVYSPLYHSAVTLRTAMNYIAADIENHKKCEVVDLEDNKEEKEKIKEDLKEEPKGV